MKLNLNILLSCILHCAPGLAVIYELFASTVYYHGYPFNVTQHKSLVNYKTKKPVELKHCKASNL